MTSDMRAISAIAARLVSYWLNVRNTIRQAYVQTMEFCFARVATCRRITRRKVPSIDARKCSYSRSTLLCRNR